MKRITLFVLVFLAGILTAEDFTAQARVGGFVPSSSRIREIYREVIPLYQLELEYRLCQPWSVWANGGFATERGHSLGKSYSTRLNLYPFSLGMKYTFFLPCNLEAYLGAGIAGSYLHIRDHSEFVKENVRKGSFGGIAKTGVRYPFCNGSFLELFLDYTFLTHTLRGSGLFFGAGVGVEF